MLGINSFPWDDKDGATLARRSRQDRRRQARKTKNVSDAEYRRRSAAIIEFNQTAMVIRGQLAIIAHGSPAAKEVALARLGSYFQTDVVSEIIERATNFINSDDGLNEYKDMGYLTHE